MKAKLLPFALATTAMLVPPPAAASSQPPTPAPPPAAPTCSGAEAERTALQAERTALNGAIGDIALGKSRKRRKVGGGEVAAGVAGTAASVLLPFGIGALLSAGAGAAARSGRKRKPAPPPPDVPAMIDRLRAIDARLAALAGCGGE